MALARGTQARPKKGLLAKVREPRQPLLTSGLSALVSPARYWALPWRARRTRRAADSQDTPGQVGGRVMDPTNGIVRHSRSSADLHGSASQA